MKPSSCIIGMLLLLMCAGCQNPLLPLSKMTDSDLNRLVKENHSFQDMRRSLGIEHVDYHIMENGSVETETCRFIVGNRYLFIDFNRSNHVVTGAFFAEWARVTPLHQNSEDTNGVRKPY